MIQDYRKTDAKVRGRQYAANLTRQQDCRPIRPAAFDLIAYTAALEVLG